VIKRRTKEKREKLQLLPAKPSLDPPRLMSLRKRDLILSSVISHDANPVERVLIALLKLLIDQFLHLPKPKPLMLLAHLRQSTLLVCSVCGFITFFRMPVDSAFVGAGNNGQSVEGVIGIASIERSQRVDPSGLLSWAGFRSLGLRRQRSFLLLRQRCSRSRLSRSRVALLRFSRLSNTGSKVLATEIEEMCSAVNSLFGINLNTLLPLLSLLGCLA